MNMHLKSKHSSISQNYSEHIKSKTHCLTSLIVNIQTVQALKCSQFISELEYNKKLEAQECKL